LSFADEKDGERRRKPEGAPETGGPNGGGGSASAPARKPKKKSATPEVGNALRSAYQRTLDEDIPPEMMDLLGKLG
jgi:hypothetical protein